MTRGDLLQFAAWSEEFDRTLLALVPDPNEPGQPLDPDLVSILPYQARGARHSPIPLEVEVRNYASVAVDADVSLNVPRGWSVEPSHQEASVGPGESPRLRFEVVAPREAETNVRHVVFADVVLGGRRLGLAAECLVVLD